MVYRFCVVVLLAPALLSLVCAEERRAIVILKGDPGVSGNVTFSQMEDDGPVTIRGTISGLSKGKHGFHIHEKGDLTSGCKSTEGHFNPDKKNHGGPNDEVRHAGDLGNIFAEDNGVADVVITDKIISLVGKYSILGRAVVVHSDADDLGRGGFSDSLTTGHAGTRVACGVIGIQHPSDPWFQGASSASFHFVSTVTLGAALLARVLH
ncbi:superoxide dismutase [Cu-Zn]-like isoform X2 [Macrosteles quadrilineatus]|uniref:superoxide dismutase [Cu-Zn]-like n=1 Tax=Macrosteles quadrilineatus TaxID=74068 RepID=UPI0023E24FDE|nr:superoxide dismutase [Cu-Zn]-like [Macrosteles quadrilineatus]XP_054290838.1 superoxide dismutase [Cu-Zn]-like isoform X2 [Macrosteles quadrilineatus]